MKELIIQYWQNIVGYLAIGWLLGVVLFCFIFVEKGCSMDSNSGDQPLFYYRIITPTLPQASIYVIGMLVWPLALVCILIRKFIDLLEYIIESNNQTFPCIIKWVFGWPVLLALRLCNKCVDHDND